MNKYILKSGKKVEFNLANIEKGLNLYRAFVLECKNANINLSLSQDETISDIFSKNNHVFFAIIGSEHIMECVKDCCDKVLYDGQRFNMDLFEDEEARRDFFPLMTLVGVENIRPFFPSLDTVYSLILSAVLKD